jgi:adenylate cyclase class 2
VIEQEVKLAFESTEAARRAVHAAGGRLVRSERVQYDRLLDAADGRLRIARSALRIRREAGGASVTFKGPLLPGPVKSREEIETIVADADALESLFAALGYVESERYEKTREDYLIGDAKVFLDTSRAGVFVEIEGTPDVIARTAALLGKTEADYILLSYRTLLARATE